MRELIVRERESIGKQQRQTKGAERETEREREGERERENDFLN